MRKKVFNKFDKKYNPSKSFNTNRLLHNPRRNALHHFIVINEFYDM